MRRRFFSNVPGARPYIHREHWVADLLTLVVFWAVVVAGWLGLVWFFGGGSAAAVTMVWAVGWAVYWLGNSAQAWVWRRARR